MSPTTALGAPTQSFGVPGGVPPLERQAYSVEEAAQILGIGRTSAYRACARGELPNIRIGNRILVPCAALERRLAI